MLHAEGQAGFDFGYVSGLADGRAGVTGDSLYADGRAHLRFNKAPIGWAERLYPSNYAYDPQHGLRYSEGSRNWFKKAQIPEKITRANRFHDPNSRHSFTRSRGVGRNMYGFRRRSYGRRRVFRRRAVYRSRRFY